MLRSVLSTPMRFFDAQPIGRILNRFSKDVGVADLILAPMSDLFLQNYTRVFSILILICALVPYLVLPVCLLLFVLLLVRCKAVPVTNQIMKIDLQSRSPMATQLGSSVSGIATIRAYDKATYFFHKFERAVSHNGAASFTLFTLSRALSFFLDMTALSVSVVAVFVAFAIRSDSNVLRLALIIQLLLDTLDKFQYGTKVSSDL